MATFAARITDLIGSDYTSIASNSSADLFNAAVSEVADILPTELLLKYAVNPQDMTTATWTSVEGKKVLLVTRLDSSGGTNRECRVLSIQDFEKAKESDSIYLATVHTPVYAYTTDAGTTSLEIFPVPNGTQTAKVYYFAYTSISDLAVSTIDGMPNEVEQAIVLKTCINILQTYISDFVQDEEDMEMQNMLNNQIKQLENQYQTEIMRYSREGKKPKGE
jgi:hypothetical protein